MSEEDKTNLNEIILCNIMVDTVNGIGKQMLRQSEARKEAEEMKGEAPVEEAPVVEAPREEEPKEEEKKESDSAVPSV